MTLTPKTLTTPIVGYLHNGISESHRDSKDIVFQFRLSSFGFRKRRRFRFNSTPGERFVFMLFYYQPIKTPEGPPEGEECCSRILRVKLHHLHAVK